MDRGVEITGSPEPRRTPPCMTGIEHQVLATSLASENGGIADAPITARIENPWRLFASHFLSMWISRSFEFAATLFIAAIYPQTLQPLSIYALVRSASAITFAPAIGQAIDTKGRLPVVRFSILAGRTAVILSSVGFWGLYSYRDTLAASFKQGIFAVLILLACLEKEASVLNLVSVERDWVVIIANDNEAVLQRLNSRMRRIDLFCKLAGPLVIALVDGASTNAALWLIFGTSMLSMPLEYYFIAKVYKRYSGLQSPKNVHPSCQARPDQPEGRMVSDMGIDDERSMPHTTANAGTMTALASLKKTPQRLAKTGINLLKFYFRHPACLPSFALSLLYLTVLSLGGQMVTYLLASGFNAFHIALVRTLSVVFELSATWIAPRVMSRIGAIRTGMWFLSLQMGVLGATLGFFWNERIAIIAASGLTGGAILSRVGLWGYDLSAQVIIQMEVQDTRRGSFSTTEVAWQNLFELLSYALTIAMPKPAQFKYPVLVSTVAVYVAGLLYGIFLRRRRGHLLHVPCSKDLIENS